MEIAVVTDKPEWVKTATFIFEPASSNTGDTDVDFEFDYPIDLQLA